MRLLFIVCVAFLAISLVGQPVDAKTWYIKDDGSGDAPSIYSAIADSAASGDTLLLAAGTFVESDLDITDMALVITSENGPDVTIVDCQFGNYGFFQSSAVLSTGYMEISGITVTNAGLWGAIALASDNDTIRVENCTITDSNIGVNTYTVNGSCTVHNNRISGCNDGIGMQGPGLTTITNNEITSNVDGIQILANVNFLVDGNTFTDNTSESIVATDDSLVGTISNNYISGNNTGSSALALGSGGQVITVSNNVIFDNADPAFTIFGAPGDSIYATNNTIHNCAGGFIVFLNTPSQYLLMSNNNITSSGATVVGIGVSGTVEYSCNNFWSSPLPVYGTDLGGNFSLNPLYCDPAADNYGLTRYSPCLGGACG